MREARGDRRDRVGTARVQAQEADRSGALVLEAKAASLSFADRIVLADATTTVMRGDKIGIIGPNGSGKTTLIRLLLGDLAPDSGTVRQGTNLEVAYFDQLRAALDEERTVQDNVGEGYENVVINGQPRHVLGYLQDFLFAPERARTLVRVLSGGERNRLLLAKLFTKPSNVLVLDEPTNHLDVETLELLENLLVDYQGTILLVSHDRTFLNNVATSVLSIDETGRVRESPGGYDDWLRRSEAEAAAARAASVTTPAPAATVAKDKARKASYKERKELEALPGRIDALEREQAQIHEAMAAPEFYQQEFAAIGKVNARLEAIAQELATAFDRWEALDVLDA